MPARMTPSVWGQGARNAIVCLIGVLVFGWVVAAAISLVSGQRVSDSFSAAIAVLTGFFFVLTLGTWLSGRANAGRVLLDCGPHPTRTLFLIYAGLLIILALWHPFAAPSALEADAIFGPALLASCAALSLIMGTGRLQIRENGIWQYSSLLRWDRIGSYRWVDDSTLAVTPKGLLSFFKGMLPVPPEQREAIEGFLAERSRATKSN